MVGHGAPILTLCLQPKITDMTVTSILQNEIH